MKREIWEVDSATEVQRWEGEMRGAWTSNISKSGGEGRKGKMYLAAEARRRGEEKGSAQ